MAILWFGFVKHYSWRNNAGTKLNVQHGKKLPLIKRKKYLLLFNRKFYTNKSLYNCAPGTTEYLLRSVIPSAANTFSSIKLLPVHVAAGLLKI